jgi:hypothetical protein
MSYEYIQQNIDYLWLVFTSLICSASLILILALGLLSYRLHLNALVPRVRVGNHDPPIAQSVL